MLERIRPWAEDPRDRELPPGYDPKTGRPKEERTDIDGNTVMIDQHEDEKDQDSSRVVIIEMNGDNSPEQD